jgi:LPS export ABC transporter protein LptC
MPDVRGDRAGGWGGAVVRRPRRAARLTRSGCAALALLAALGPGPASGSAATTPESGTAADSAPLRITGMTFVGSRGQSAELVLHSERATFHPDRDIAELEEVEAVWTDAAEDERFTMTCERAELDVESNDFVAEGDVRGETAEGQRYAAPVVYYDHEQALLHSDRRVTLVDDTGTLEGDGFRYLLREGSFQLLGNVRVVREP